MMKKKECSLQRIMVKIKSLEDRISKLVAFKSELEDIVHELNCVDTDEEFEILYEIYDGFI